MKKAFGILFVFVFFSSCSWQEYFAVENNSDSSIIVSYTISKVDGFPIFDGTADAYKTTSSGEIDWNNKIALEDKDTSAFTLQNKIPPNSIIMIGHLSNDNYSKYDQYFINGRIFNLQTLEIKKEDRITSITKEKFDSYFKKKDGIIKYEVK